MRLVVKWSATPSVLLGTAAHRMVPRLPFGNFCAQLVRRDPHKRVASHFRLAHSRKPPVVPRWNSEAGLGAVRQQQGIGLKNRGARFPTHPAHRVEIRNRWKRQQVAGPIDGLPGRAVHTEGTERQKHRRQCEGTGNYLPGVGCLRTSGDEGGITGHLILLSLQSLSMRSSEG